jgi:hypothetical protein
LGFGIWDLGFGILDCGLTILGVAGFHTGMLAVSRKPF